jgi:integrase
VKSALAVIDEVLGEFPYDTEASKANAIAALLTPVLRPAIQGPVPLALLDAPQQGSGKSLLANVIGLVATGRPIAMMAATESEEQWRKRITGTLYSGASVITIDNLESQLKSASLANALTSEIWRDRVLGRTEASDQFQMLMDNVPLDIRLMIAMAVTTGMRVSEIIGLKWKHMDLDRGIVRVEERYYRGDTDAPKTEGSKRELPLGKLGEALRKHQPADWQPDGYIFTRDGGPMDDRAILRDTIRPAAKQLGIYFEGFGWHSFRRQNLTLLQEEGATTFEAMAQAGHSRPQMTGEYTIVDLKRRNEAVVRVQERLKVSSLVN